MKIESKLDNEIELKINIEGSEGAQFEGSHALVKEVSVGKFVKMDVAQVKLSGDWLLRIKFTYTIKNHDGSDMIPKALLERMDK